MLTFPRLYVAIVILIVRAVRVLARSRADLVLENLALKQQVTALKRERLRPYLDDADRGFWVAFRESWAGWADRLVIVTPEAIVKWHQQRFRRYWTRISHKDRSPGRPRIDPEVRKLIRTMALDNGWGAPRIHGELLKLGSVVCEATVSRYMPRRRPEPEKVQRWLTFLRNHADAIAAMDFFTVPTIRLRVLYCFFVIEHGRRRVLHFNAKLGRDLALCAGGHGWISSREALTGHLGRMPLRRQQEPCTNAPPPTRRNRVGYR